MWKRYKSKGAILCKEPPRSSELGASLPEPAAMYNNKKRPNELSHKSAALSAFPIKLSLRSITPHTPAIQHPFPNECFSSARLG